MKPQYRRFSKIAGVPWHARAASLKKPLPGIPAWMRAITIGVLASLTVVPATAAAVDVTHPPDGGSANGVGDRIYEIQAFMTDVRLPKIFTDNGMIHPMVRFPIKGALWYQGESNGDEGDEYCDKMRDLIGGWRQQWKQGDFPFYFVQISSWMGASEDPAGEMRWARLRQAQTKSLAIPNTGMAVTIDIGDANNIHPHNKFDVGKRLALWALAKDYGKKDLVCSGPLYKGMKVEGGKIHISFDSIGSGLMAGSKAGLDPTVEDKGAKLKRFAIAGTDKKWVWAEAVIEDNTVTVSSPEVKEPAAVRYAYQMNPAGANLYNRDGLPASPFRTDDW